MEKTKRGKTVIALFAGVFLVILISLVISGRSVNSASFSTTFDVKTIPSKTTTTAPVTSTVPNTSTTTAVPETKTATAPATTTVTTTPTVPTFTISTNSGTTTVIVPKTTTTTTPATTTSTTTAISSTGAANATNDTTNTGATNDVAKSSSSWVNLVQQKITLVSKDARIAIDAENMSRVLFYVSRDGSSSPFYLGSANKENASRWSFLVDTQKQLPNGTYSLYAVLTSINGGQSKSSEVQLVVDVPSDAQAVANTTDSAIANKVTENVVAEIDSDNDGISDSEEKRIGTNIYLADTDGDGFLDGDEVKNGFNPLKYSPGDGRDKVAFQSPKEFGAVKQEYKVEKVEMIKAEVGGQDKLKFSGKALPNTYIAVYIYSTDPIIVMVKTDSNGDWAYELDRDLNDGEHETFVAVTDNTGKITAKSEPLRFIKTAEAATTIPSAQTQSPLENSKSNFITFGFVTIILFLIVSLALIGVATFKHYRQ